VPDDTKGVTARRQAIACADRELVAASLGGDKDAFGMLVDRHRPMVLSLVTRLLGARDEARDVVQEAAVTALVGLDRLRSADRFGAWFAGIALNIGRRWLREGLGVVSTTLEHGDEGPGPAELAVLHDLADRVRAAVGALAPGQREAVLAFYYRGLSHADAAAELGITAGAVKARLHQARGALAMSLAPHVEGAVQAGARRGRVGRRGREVTAVEGSDTVWVETEVADVRRSDHADPTLRFHAVVLDERGGPRQLAIYIGPAEATALAFNLQAVETPRPMTYAMAAGLTAAAGASVSEVRITRLADHVYYALVRLDTPSGPREVDARPSDALNLALVCDVPVLVHRAVFDEAADGQGWSEWRGFPVHAAELVEETEEIQAAVMAAACGQRSRGEAGGL
jgi:RNA polymerase sigma factor (sigma-70 family)